MRRMTTLRPEPMGYRLKQALRKVLSSVIALRVTLVAGSLLVHVYGPVHVFEGLPVDAILPVLLLLLYDGRCVNNTSA